MKQLKFCEKGHRFYKSSTCESCPTCAKQDKPKEGFLHALAAPARRAMEANGIKKEEDLTRFTLKEIMAMHGLGKTSIPILESALKEKGLSFKSE